MHRWAGFITLVFSTSIATFGCARPITQIGSVSAEDVRAEQQQQLQLAAELALTNQQRVDRLAAPLLRAAAPLCGRTTQVRRVKSGRGDPGRVAPTATDCPFSVVVQRGEALNAAADGSNIFVESALLRFASDEELSVVLAHEIAHNAMRHRDAQTKNMLGGALLGALADVASAYGGHNTRGEYAKLGAQAGAQAFSQDFEREADYVGMYILAWAGLPVDKASLFWRRMAVEHPAGIVFATTHPTTAERYVRLEQWAREVDLKVASDSAFGPEMRDQRLRVASRPLTTPRPRVSGGEVVLAKATETASPALGVDAGNRPSPPQAPVAVASLTTTASKPGTSAPAAALSTASALEEERYAQATIGAPRSEAERAAAVPAYEKGMTNFGAQRWGQAKVEFKRALALDGSVAAYHAALGEVLIVEEDWAGAAAEFTAALLLDVDNPQYRARLKEARARK